MVFPTDGQLRLKSKQLLKKKSGSFPLKKAKVVPRACSGPVEAPARGASKNRPARTRRPVVVRVGGADRSALLRAVRGWLFSTPSPSGLVACGALNSPSRQSVPWTSWAVLVRHLVGRDRNVSF